MNGRAEATYTEGELGPLCPDDWVLCGANPDEALDEN